MTKFLSNENVKREALKLRDVLLKYDRREDANYLEQHVAELGDPNTVEDALWSLKGMCHPKWLGDVYLPEHEQAPYEWLRSLQNALTKSLRRSKIDWTGSSNENVKREALKLRDLLLQYDRKEDANSLEQHVAELDDPNSVKMALWSLRWMCHRSDGGHPNWLGDVYLPEHDQRPGAYAWLLPLQDALRKALRRYR